MYVRARPRLCRVINCSDLYNSVGAALRRVASAFEPWFRPEVAGQPVFGVGISQFFLDLFATTYLQLVPGRRRVRLPVELRADAAARGRAEEQRQLRADVPAHRVRGPAARGRADAPRQLLRVSRPSTTTSPFPGGTAALHCAQVPSSPLSVLSRVTRSGAVLPSSFGALLHSSRVMSRSLLNSVFFLRDGVLVVLEVPNPSNC